MPVTFIAYGGESDSGFRDQVGYPIPEAAKSQPELNPAFRSLSADDFEAIQLGWR